MIKTQVDRFTVSTRYCVWFEDRPLKYVHAYKGKEGPAYVAIAALGSLNIRDVNRLIAALEELIEKDVFGERE